MYKKYLFAIVIVAFTLGSCHRKSHPGKSTTESADAPKPAPPRPKVKKEPTPKMISVNDQAAKKSVDGRLYYDLEGHRYWRNKRDGKYYLFNKKMFDDPDFKP